MLLKWLCVPLDFHFPASGDCLKTSMISFVLPHTYKLRIAPCYHTSTILPVFPSALRSGRRKTDVPPRHPAPRPLLHKCLCAHTGLVCAPLRAGLTLQACTYIGLVCAAAPAGAKNSVPYLAAIISHSTIAAAASTIGQALRTTAGSCLPFIE